MIPVRDVSADEGDYADHLDAFLSSSAASQDAYAAMGYSQKAAANIYNVTFDGFDKSQWKRVKLSDVATEYSERVNDPSQSEYEWYIGSDCIEGFAFDIAKREPASKVHSAQKLFRAGDYLLVRRSLYGSDFRERAPRATFDGVCSADILTIREIPGMIADGYLIAVLYSKRLWEFIVSNSTGSLTRRIKWNQLKDFEFDLPPMPLQEQLSKLLWSMEKAKSAYRKLIALTNDLVKSQFVEMFGDPEHGTKNVPVCSLGELLTLGPQNGMYKAQSYYRTDGSGVPIVRVDSFYDGRVTDFSTLKRLICTEAEVVLYGLEDDDLIFNRVNGSVEHVGKCARIQGLTEDTVFESNVMRAKVNKELVDICYLSTYLCSDIIRKQIKKVARVANQASVNQDNIRGLPIPLPSMQHQREYALLVEQTDKSKLAAKQALDDLTAAQRALMRQYLG